MLDPDKDKIEESCEKLCVTLRVCVVVAVLDSDADPACEAEGVPVSVALRVDEPDGVASCDVVALTLRDWVDVAVGVCDTEAAPCVGVCETEAAPVVGVCDTETAPRVGVCDAEAAPKVGD